MQRSRGVRNRMLEFCTSGSVGAWVGDHPGLPGQFARVLVIDRLLLTTNQGGIDPENEPIVSGRCSRKGTADSAAADSGTADRGQHEEEKGGSWRVPAGWVCAD